MIGFVSEIFVRIETERGSVIEVPMIADIKRHAGRQLVYDRFFEFARARLEAISIGDPVKQVRMEMDGAPIEPSLSCRKTCRRGCGFGWHGFGLIGRSGGKAERADGCWLWSELRWRRCEDFLGLGGDD
jgi:hypothetical protein